MYKKMNTCGVLLMCMMVSTPWCVARAEGVPGLPLVDVNGKEITESRRYTAPVRLHPTLAESGPEFNKWKDAHATVLGPLMVTPKSPSGTEYTTKLCYVTFNSGRLNLKPGEIGVSPDKPEVASIVCP